MMLPGHWHLVKRDAMAGPPSGLEPIDLLWTDPPVPFKTDQMVVELRRIWQQHMATDGIIVFADCRFNLPHAEYLPYVEDQVLQYSKVGGLVADPFCGTSTTGVAAIANDRKYYGADVREKCIIDSQTRLQTLERVCLL